MMMLIMNHLHRYLCRWLYLIIEIHRIRHGIHPKNEFVHSILCKLRFNNWMDSASFFGSAKSTAIGLPVFTAQNLQALVQTSPKIIKVAVPASQHSPILGQSPLVQMVCRLFLRIIPLTSAKLLPIGKRIFNQSGFRLEFILFSIVF